MKCINFIGEYSLNYIQALFSKIIPITILEDVEGLYCFLEDEHFFKFKILSQEENIKVMISHNRDKLTKLTLQYANNHAMQIFHISDLIFKYQNDKINHELKSIFLKVDSYLMHTVKMFMENNLNVVQTAHEIYVHRNTLNYRLQLFYNITGIDVKDYQNMLLVYFYLNCA